MMAFTVHLKTVAQLRGKSDRIAKVTFRGRTSNVSLLQAGCVETKSLSVVRPDLVRVRRPDGKQSATPWLRKKVGEAPGCMETRCALAF